MDKNSLVRKAKLGMAGLGLVGILNGCAAMDGMNESQMQAALGAALTTSDNPQDVLVGSIMYTLGMMEHQKEVAIAGKDEITININPNVQPGQNTQVDSRLIPEYNLKQLEQEVAIGSVGMVRETLGLTETEYPQFGLQNLFTYSRFLDLNGDGISSLNEFDPKRNFKKGELVNVCVIYSDTAYEVGKPFWGTEITPTTLRISTRVSNNKNLIVYNGDEEFTMDKSYGPKDKRIINFELGGNLAPGIYNITCNFSDNYPDGNWRHRRTMKTQMGGVFQVLE